MYQSDVEGAKALVKKYELLKEEISKVIVGQNEIIHNTILSVFCQGHVLLVGVPGLAKTLLVSTIGRALGLSFNRIQFTPDLMPSDILGTEILDDSRQFKFVKGPVFSNIILAERHLRLKQLSLKQCRKNTSPYRARHINYRSLSSCSLHKIL